MLILGGLFISQDEIFLAAEYCLWDHVKERVTQKPDLANAVQESSGRTLLHFAARYRAPTDLIELLIRFNSEALSLFAPMEEGYEDAYDPLSGGFTPLHEACMGPGLMLPEAIECLRVLLRESPRDALLGQVESTIFCNLI
jgi:ankyrin repeat protein